MEMVKRRISVIKTTRKFLYIILNLITCQKFLDVRKGLLYISQKSLGVNQLY
jgi:hypothetical protein